MELDKLIEAEGDGSQHIYLVQFEIKTMIPVIEEVGWVSDELSVAVMEDGMAAIEKVKAFVLDEEEYGVQVEEFRLKGLKLLAKADIEC